jgi:peptide/nickel transport system permease protein
MPSDLALPLAAPRHRARRGGLWIGGGIVGGIVLLALLGPLLWTASPYAQSLGARLVPPVFLDGSWEHPLGTDHLGRDYLARLLHGGRVSLLVGFGTVLASGVIGIGLGLVAGYHGGRVDAAVMFLVTVRLALPIILVALAVIGLVGATLPVVMAVLAGLLWDRFAIVTRSLAMQARDRDYVLAARAVGRSDGGILLREILPNLTGPVTIVATLEMAHAILLEAALSFLGLGVQPPGASWGLMIAEAKDFVFFEPWLVNVPGLALFVLVMGINLLGDGLRDLSGGGR